MENCDEKTEERGQSWSTNRLVKYGTVNVWTNGKWEPLPENIQFEIGGRKVFDSIRNEYLAMFTGCDLEVNFDMGTLEVDTEEGQRETVHLVGSIPAICKVGYFPPQDLTLTSLEKYQELVDNYATECGLRNHPSYFAKMRATSPPLMCALCAPSLDSNSMSIFVLFVFTFFTLDDIFDNLMDFWNEMLPIPDMKEAVDNLIRVLNKRKALKLPLSKNKFPLLAQMCKMLCLLRSKLDAFEPKCVAQFLSATTAIFETWPWEARMNLKPSDSATTTLQKFYIEIRDITGGMLICIELIAVFNNIHLSPAIRRDPLFKIILIWMSRCVTLENDIFSFKKEMNCRETANAVWLKGHKMTLDGAFQDVLRRTAQYVADIQGLQERLLRKFRRERNSLQAYFKMCNLFIDSGIQFYLLSHRYGTSTFSVNVLNHLDSVLTIT